MNNKYDRKIKEITLKDGSVETIVIEPENAYDVNMDGNYVLSNNPYSNNAKKKGLLTRNIGLGSEGFTKTITLAAIVSIVGIIIVIIIFKY